MRLAAVTCWQVDDRLPTQRQPVLHCWAAMLLVVLIFYLADPARAQWFENPAEAEINHDENPYAAGIIASFQGANGIKCKRLVEGLAYVWGTAPPDRRLSTGPYVATFSGRLWTQAPGTYTLRVFAAGRVRLRINDALLLDGQRSEPGWITAKPVELPFGYHPFELEYERKSEVSRLSVFWEGPQFGLEPIGQRWLFHDRDQTPTSDFERGELLVRGLRCAACHVLPVKQPPLAAASLASLESNLSRAWLIDWLSSANPDGQSVARRMPHFQFSREEATAIADTLVAASEPFNEAKPLPTEHRPQTNGKRNGPSPPSPSAELGASLFRSVGCLACHNVDQLGTNGLFGGGNLSRVATKRPPEFFESWLAGPARHNRDHRMPVFPLTADQQMSLSLYLQTLGKPTKADSATTSAPNVDGEMLIQGAGCANCHTLPKSLAGNPGIAKTPLGAESLTAGGDACLSKPDRDKGRPGFRLSDDNRLAIRKYLTTVVPRDKPIDPTGHQLVVDNNCLACHARGSATGLASKLPAVAEADPGLAEILPALQPPALHSVGDKLVKQALIASLEAPNPPRRPWLHVRMPRFKLGEKELVAIADDFVATDRIPPRSDLKLDAFDASLPPSSLDAAGPRLVTADGFGCTSCHAIGKWEPLKVALNAHGTALSNIGNRVRREWFDRWVRNPARIVPKMEMPSVQQPVRGVLDQRLDEQLAAVWRVLNRPDFTPPNPSALRVVRRANLGEMPERAAVLTDVIEVGSRGFIKPLVVGLDNRHNVLLDLATARLAAWWIGDTARQQTRGKSWYWEAGMPQLLPINNDDDVPSDLALIDGDQLIHARSSGQFITEFDSLEHTARGLLVAYRLRYQIDGDLHQIRVRESFDPSVTTNGQAGFRRSVTIEDAPANSKWQLAILPRPASIDDDGQNATLVGPRGRVSVSIAEKTHAVALHDQTSGLVATFQADGTRVAGVTLDYRADAQADQFLPLPAVDRTLERQELGVVPGYQAVRLPTTDEAMPTGLAWKSDGTVVISSLEGRVWMGRDSDGDELIDQLKPFADDLAAPYGVQVVESTKGTVVDVINKYAVLRLYDEDGDDLAERTETIASGWGHTRDYHDWAIGLPRDPAGNYYMALPCEQDGRSEAAAYLRGRALKLIPREPTKDAPRRFSIEEICAGLRFPQGLALSPSGDLFATDNQGNYNPFNELNHLQASARYGFINSLEAKRGLKPPSQPAAIEIPHPWTRSVNGICYGPAPYSNDLIGCEYDTRRLVRMTLEHNGSEWQGAVYPFSREPIGDEPTFEGPLSCCVAPSGDLYIGNIRDSGWGAGSNTGSLVRLRYRGLLEPGIARVRSVPDGFAIRFTTPIDAVEAENPASYTIVSYRRISTPAYGGDDVDRRAEKISQIQVSPDETEVVITLDTLREGFVYEFHIRNVGGGDTFFPAEAYYTLRHKMPY